MGRVRTGPEVFGEAGLVRGLAPVQRVVASEAAKPPAVIRGQFYFERLLNLSSTADTAAVRAEIAASVDLFLKAYPIMSVARG